MDGLSWFQPRLHPRLFDHRTPVGKDELGWLVAGIRVIYAAIGWNNLMGRGYLAVDIRSSCCLCQVSQPIFASRLKVKASSKAALGHSYQTGENGIYSLRLLLQRPQSSIGESLGSQSLQWVCLETVVQLLSHF